jgi:hypothetical protein
MPLQSGPGPSPILDNERDRDRLEGKAHHRDRDRDRDRARARPHPPPFFAPPPSLPLVREREPRPHPPVMGQGGRRPMELDHERERERDINFERRPHPSIPVCFWGDDARGTLFLKACYGTYPGVWHHGDFIAMNPHTRGYIIFGRRFAFPALPSSHLRLLCVLMRASITNGDGVLNPSGVRFGSGEIYSVLERSELVACIDDAICVGQR